MGVDKKAELLTWMRKKQVFATHEVVKWGIENYSVSADRYKREFVEKGIIEPIPQNELAYHGIRTNPKKWRYYRIVGSKELYKPYL